MNMSLDAAVYCDCMERGRLRTLPHPDWRVYVDESGARFGRTDDLEVGLAFDRWDADACEHEDGTLLHHWLGNIAGISLIRDTLSQFPERFSLILSKVVYNGTHCGDYLSVDQ